MKKILLVSVCLCLLLTAGTISVFAIATRESAMAVETVPVAEAPAEEAPAAELFAEVTPPVKVSAEDAFQAMLKAMLEAAAAEESEMIYANDPILDHELKISESQKAALSEEQIEALRQLRQKEDNMYRYPKEAAIIMGRIDADAPLLTAENVLMLREQTEDLQEFLSVFQTLCPYPDANIGINMTLEIYVLEDGVVMISGKTVLLRVDDTHLALFEAGKKPAEPIPFDMPVVP